MGIDAADIAVQRQTKGVGSSFGNCQAGSQDGIGAQFGFVGGAIQVKHRHIEGFLFNCILTHQGFGNLVIDILNGFENAFAEIAGFIAIAHFQGFMGAGGCPGGHGCPAPAAISQDDFNFNGRIAAGIQNFLAKIDSIVVSMIP